MANTSVFRNAGQTYALSVTNTAHASVQINATTNDQINYAAFLNNSVNPIAIKVSSVNPCPAAVFPTDGTPGDYVLPPIMETPIVLAVPALPFYMTAISNVAGPSLLYVTPTADQS